jgi:uncharacterized iron-regulated membrane protein
MITDRLTIILSRQRLMNPADAAETVSQPASVMHHVKLRKVWWKCHAYLGLFGGGIFALMGLSGSLLVFYKSIDECLNPMELRSNGAGLLRPLNEIVSAAQEAGPPGSVLDAIDWPSHRHGVYTVWHRAQDTTADSTRWIQATIDPYSGDVLSKNREWGRYAVSFIYELHQSLLIDTAGETILGVVAIFLLVSIGTGLYLWWPRPGRLRHAFTVVRTGSVIRRHYDWHKLSGLYSAIVLGMLAFTGVYLEFGDYVVPIVRLFSPVQEFPKEEAVQSLPGSDARPLSVEEAVALAREVFPEGELRYVGVPHGGMGVYQVGLRQPGEVRESGGESQVWLDQYSGKVLLVHDWRQFTGGETFLAWLFPLHNGEAFGLVGRWIVFLVGFVPLILYVTALRMWWLKRMAHRRQRENSQALT